MRRIALAISVSFATLLTSSNVRFAYSQTPAAPAQNAKGASQTSEESLIELNDDKVLYAFSKDLEPALTVESGETVRIRTKDCFGNQLKTPEDKLDSIDWDRINPATGPIFVNGAVAGGALQVKIENIEFDATGVTCTGEGEGVCGDRFDAWSTIFCQVGAETVRFADKLDIQKPSVAELEEILGKLQSEA